MNNTVLKNILVILGLLTVAFAGYYMYTQQDSVTLHIDNNDAQYQQMLNNTQIFIQRRQELYKTNLDIQVFEDARFNSLRSYSKPLKGIDSGRKDPFAAVGVDT